MALNIGTARVDLALHVTADSCEHVLPEDRQKVYAHLGSVIPGLAIAGEIIGHTATAPAEADSMSAILHQSHISDDVLEVVSAGGQLSIADASAYVSGRIGRELRGVTLTPEDGERIIEAVRARVR